MVSGLQRSTGSSTARLIKNLGKWNGQDGSCVEWWNWCGGIRCSVRVHLRFFPLSCRIAVRDADACEGTQFWIPPRLRVRFTSFHSTVREIAMHVGQGVGLARQKAMFWWLWWAPAAPCVADGRRAGGLIDWHVLGPSCRKGHLHSK